MRSSSVSEEQNSTTSTKISCEEQDDQLKASNHNDERKHTAIKENVNTGKSEHKLLRREFRVAKTLSIVTIIYIICLLPINITLLVTVTKSDNRLPNFAFAITFLLLLCNSCVNPIIYTLFNRNFRKAFKTVLGINK